MTNFIWMSDPHFTDTKIYGHDPRMRLNAAINFINSHFSDADFCIISGDMVNRGGNAEYEGLAEILTQLKTPYYPMVGNHDTRDLFKKHLPVPSNCMADFVQFSIETAQGKILCLDTLNAGHDNGMLCDERMGWLENELINSGGAPVYIFMHHPPAPIGLPQQDASCLANSKAFLDLVTQFPAVKYLFLAHVHRPMSGTISGIPFATMRSILYQAPAIRPDWTWADFAPAIEAPNIGNITLKSGDTALQYLQFCSAEFGVSI